MTNTRPLLLPGLNPENVKGYVLKPMRDTRIYVVPERALEVLEVMINGNPVMFRNPKGHKGSSSYNGHGLGPLAHIEGAFTAGLENVGGPQAHAPLHGTFSVTPVDRESLKFSNSAISGTVHCEQIVTGPAIDVHRTIEAIQGERAFLIRDTLEATLDTYFMWLYHPNFPVREGTQFYSSETAVVYRDLFAQFAGDYQTFGNVRKGTTLFPPAADAQRIQQQNFEQCYIMRMQPDSDGNVYAMLISSDGTSASYVRYKPEQFQATQRAFQLWKNPRGACAGLEVGSTFHGWDYAVNNDLLCHLNKGAQHTYEIEIGFLTSAMEVDAMKAKINHATSIIPEIMDQRQQARFYKAAGGK